MRANPILVQMTRGEMVENFFRGSYIISDPQGNIIDSVGDVDRLIYPRSALKPIQVIGLLESGAAEVFHVSSSEIALACASHNGEDRHVHIVTEWLNRLGFNSDDLECGIHASMDKNTMLAMVREGRKLTPVYNACSGKHVAFITLCLHLNVPIKNYTHLDHPVQRYVNRLIAEVIEIDILRAPKGIDGCQVPVIGMPLKNLAKGMAKLTQPDLLRPELGNASQRMITALQTHPELIAGTGRFCSFVTQESGGKIIAKMGADGVFSVMLPDQKWGIALKVDDGNLRVAEVMLMGILFKHNLLSQTDVWKKWAQPPVKTWNGQVVGGFTYIG